MPARIRVQAEDFDPDAEVTLMTSGRRDIGAVVTFIGYCRDEGGRLAALELEHYPGMAEEEIGRVAAQAMSRWPLDAVTVVHRHGKIAPGGRIVFVATASSHRAAAFAGAEFLMDYLKTQAPFWKKEHPLNGPATDWVKARDADDSALERWGDKDKLGGLP